jgi:tape measure domain-containing protein
VGTGVQFTLKVIDKASAVFDKIGLSLGNLKLAVSGLGAHLATGLAVGGAAAAGLLALLARNAVNLAGSFEQAMLAFTHMLGSPGAARSYLEELQVFANKTPFEFPELVDTAQKLMAVGMAAKDVIPSMTAIGDAVSGLGGSAEVMGRVRYAITQIITAGKVMGTEMRQLTEANIPAWRYLAEAIGTTTAGAMDMVTKGAVDSKFGLDALLKGMTRDFGGMMAIQSRSLFGVISTLRDTFNFGLRQLGEAALPGLKQLAVTLTILSERLFSKDNLKNITAFFSGIFSDENAFKAAAFIGNMVAGIEYLGDSIKIVWDGSKTAVATFAEYAVSALIDVGNFVTFIINKINGAGGLEVALLKLGHSILEFLRPLAQYLAFGEAMSTWWDTGSPMKAADKYKSFMSDFDRGMKYSDQEIKNKELSIQPLPYVSNELRDAIAASVKAGILSPNSAWEELGRVKSERALGIQGELFGAWKEAGAFLADTIKPQKTALDTIAGNTGQLVNQNKSALSAIFGNGGDRMQAMQTRARFGNLNTKGGGLSVNVTVATPQDAATLRYALQYAASMNR